MESAHWSLIPSLVCGNQSLDTAIRWTRIRRFSLSVLLVLYLHRNIGFGRQCGWCSRLGMGDQSTIDATGIVSSPGTDRRGHEYTWI